MEKQKKPRESTDLAEYIFLGTNNFSQLQIVKKLELCKDWQKGEDFFFIYRNMLALNMRFARFDYNIIDPKFPQDSKNHT